MQSKELFPKLVLNEYRQRTAKFSKWFSRYLRQTIGISDKRKTFHGFRHGFKEACRLAEIPKDIHDQLTGHSSSDVGDGYGGELYPLPPLYSAILKIEFQLNQNTRQRRGSCEAQYSIRVSTVGPVLKFVIV
jgi:hypothetical protein